MHEEMPWLGESAEFDLLPFDRPLPDHRDRGVRSNGVGRGYVRTEPRRAGRSEEDVGPAGMRSNDGSGRSRVEVEREGIKRGGYEWAGTRDPRDEGQPGFRLS